MNPQRDKDAYQGKRLLTAMELARYLAIPRGTIYVWNCERRIPAQCVVKLGRALRFDIAAIDRWIDAQRASPQKSFLDNS